MTKIRYVDGVPRWFVRLYHKIWVRKCNKVGHTSGHINVPVYTCVRCGEIVRELE